MPPVGRRHRRGGHMLLRRRNLITLVSAIAAALLTAGTAQAATVPSAAHRVPERLPGLGQNVLVFDPSMPTAQIQAAVDAVAAEQVSNQFGTQRYALLFKPGTYGSVDEPLH